MRHDKTNVYPPSETSYFSFLFTDSLNSYFFVGRQQIFIYSRRSAPNFDGAQEEISSRLTLKIIVINIKCVFR